MKLTYEKAQIDIRNWIKNCERLGHIQQVAYSTHHDALTQICFTCNAVRTNMATKTNIERKG